MPGLHLPFLGSDRRLDLLAHVLAFGVGLAGFVLGLEALPFGGVEVLGQALELLLGGGEFGARLVALALGIGVAVFQGDDGGMIVDAVELKDELAILLFVHGVQCVLDTIEAGNDCLQSHRLFSFGVEKPAPRARKNPPGWRAGKPRM